MLPGWYHGNADLLRFAASVDYETDKKIQDTIASEFEDRTILCIARKFPTSHRGRGASILTITPQIDFKLSSVMTGSASWTLDGSPNSIPRRGCSTWKVGSSVVCATVPRFRSRISEEPQSYERSENSSPPTLPRGFMGRSFDWLRI